jgi:hypothetical protein
MCGFRFCYRFGKAAAFGLLLFSCTNSMEEVRQFDEEGEERPFLVTHGLTLAFYDSSGQRFWLEGPSRQIFTGGDNPRSELPDGMRMIFDTDSSGAQTQMLANHAVFYERSGLMKATGNVQMITGEGDSLLTELLFWNDAQQIIYTHFPVRIYRHPGRYFESLYLLSNTSFTEYQMDALQGVMRVEE